MNDSEKRKALHRLLIFHYELSLEKSKKKLEMIRLWVCAHIAAHNTEGTLSLPGFREGLLAEAALKGFPEDEQGEERSAKRYLCLCKH